MMHSAAHEFDVAAPIELVFPLFDARNEAEWAPDWKYTPCEPQPFRLMRNAIFEVPSNAVYDDSRAESPELWIVLDFDEVAHRVEYLALRGRHFVRRVTVACQPRGRETHVSVRYDLTALDAEGTAKLAHFDKSYLATWEQPVRDAARRRQLAASAATIPVSVSPGPRMALR
jgi:hypothetical protein